MTKNGEEYELFVQDIYKILNCADGLKDVVVQHDVKIEGVSREHQIDVYWQFTCGTVTYRVAVECKDYKNPVTAEKIEAFRATLLDIGDIHGIFEGDDEKDSRLSFGRVFTCVFLVLAFFLIAYTVYKFVAGAGWQIFIGSGIAVVAALVPYLITKISEVLAVINAIKTVKGN